MAPLEATRGADGETKKHHKLAAARRSRGAVGAHGRIAQKLAHKAHLRLGDDPLPPRAHLASHAVKKNAKRLLSTCASMEGRVSLVVFLTTWEGCSADLCRTRTRSGKAIPLGCSKAAPTMRGAVPLLWHSRPGADTASNIKREMPLGDTTKRETREPWKLGFIAHG